MNTKQITHNAIEKYGIENFERTILFFCETEDEMNVKEKEIVNEDFVARKDTYNLKIGGDGGWDYCNKGMIHNNKHNCRRTGFLQYIDNGSNPYTEWWNALSEKELNEWKEKISNGVKANINEFGFWWIGRKHKEETKAKIGKANSIHQQGTGNSHYGTHWWINPETGETHPFKDEDVPDGWIRGRTLKSKLY